VITAPDPPFSSSFVEVLEHALVPARPTTIPKDKPTIIRVIQSPVPF
jgi:hypothetical protein